MSTNPLNGQWALITGASSGLGVDFARELAGRGCNLVLVARREERLREVATGLIANHGIEVETVAMDLATRRGPHDLHDRLTAAGREIPILVNNAGFGVYGDYLDIPLDREVALIDLDVVTVVQLTKLFARDMVRRGHGRILQVASVAAYQATPTYAVYAAAKAFVLLFGEAVGHELRGTGVTCTVVSPGVTATEFLSVAGQQPTLYQRLFMKRPGQVARIAVRAMLRGRRTIVTGWANTLMAWSIRLFPRRLATATAGMLMSV
jgi:short-subunit dehydrogenase